MSGGRFPQAKARCRTRAKLVWASRTNQGQQLKGKTDCWTYSGLLRVLPFHFSSKARCLAKYEQREWKTLRRTTCARGATCTRMHTHTHTHGCQHVPKECRHVSQHLQTRAWDAHIHGIQQAHWECMHMHHKQAQHARAHTHTHAWYALTHDRQARTKRS